MPAASDIYAQALSLGRDGQVDPAIARLLAGLAEALDIVVSVQTPLIHLIPSRPNGVMAWPAKPCPGPAPGDWGAVIAKIGAELDRRRSQSV